MIGRLLRRTAGTAIVAATAIGQRRVPFLPRKQLDAIRDRRIRRIVSYAARTVPYYKDLFTRERIDVREIRGATELDKLPVLDRDHVRSEPMLFVARTRAGRTGIPFLTSGSTGTPIGIRHDKRSLLANIAYGEREREPVNKVCGGAFRPKEMYVGYDTSTFKKVIEFYEEHTALPVKPRRRFVSLLEPLDSIAAIVNEEQPDVIVGYGGWVDLFFRSVEARGLEIAMPRMVMYMGEEMPRGGRDYIEQHYGIPVLSRYNAVESFKIGFFCEERSGFHIHEDLCHVRIRTTDGRQANPGESGEVIISNLVNYASVLLNYPIGDVAAATSELCACGRTFSRLSELEGRVEDVLALPDGRFLHPRAIWQVFKDIPGVLQYQLTQHGGGRYQLTIVTVDEQLFRSALDQALPELRRLLGSENIEARWSREIDRSGHGKFRTVVRAKSL
ncbi:MAG: phenylacetate--CoA ligase family protein [Anaerolineae bacterium]|nr:phenylacetate--CoA ligase family protein [Gemmatimonadaceae bacterium]